MAYAELGDVLARAGRASGAFHEGASVDEADIEAFLSETAGFIDAVLAARGVDGSDPAVRGALRGANADAALLLALDGAFPGGRGGDEVRALRDGVRARLGLSGGQTVSARTLTVALELASDIAAGGSSGASSFWLDNPDYPTTADFETAYQRPATAPFVARGEKQ